MRPRALFFFALLGVLAIPQLASAGRKETYIYLLDKVDIAKGVPAAVVADVTDNLGTLIDKHVRLSREIPKEAPDWKTEPKKFKQYMKRRHLSAYRVTVEVSEYEMYVEDALEGSGKNVVVRIALKILGTTIPNPQLAFTGDGSAKIKLGTGRKVRQRDKDVARRDAVGLAVENALNTSIVKLDAGPKKRKRRRKRK